jgi:hypothetical protein
VIEAGQAIHRVPKKKMTFSSPSVRMGGRNGRRDTKPRQKRTTTTTILFFLCVIVVAQPRTKKAS